MAVLESKIEKDFVKKAMQEYSCIAFKFKREGIKGGSDRLIFCPNGHSFFIEFKRPGGIISPHQEEFKLMMIEFSKKVYYCYTFKEAIEALKFELIIDRKLL